MLTKIQLFENQQSEGANKSKYWEITFKVVQMKCLAMIITDQKLSFDIFMVGHLQNIFMELLWHKRKLDNFDPCNLWVIKAIATNILELLKTGLTLYKLWIVIEIAMTCFYLFILFILHVLSHDGNGLPCVREIKVSPVSVTQMSVAMGNNKCWTAWWI